MESEGGGPSRTNESPTTPNTTWNSSFNNQCINCCKPFSTELECLEFRNRLEHSNSTSRKDVPSLGSPEGSTRLNEESGEIVLENKKRTEDVVSKTVHDNSFVSELVVDRNSSAMKIGSVLNSIYRLNLEEPEETDEEFSTNLNVCMQCAEVLKELYSLHQKFDHLRSIDSYLSKQFQILDAILQQNQTSHPIKCEVSIEVDEDGNDMFLSQDYSQSSSINFCQPVVQSGRQRKHSSRDQANVENQDSRYGGSGPWVRLKRVRQSDSARGTEAKSPVAVDLSDEDSQQFGDGGSDCPSDDNDTTYGSSKKKKPSKRAPRRERKSGGNVGRGRWKRTPKYSPDERLMTAAERNRVVKAYRRKKLRHPNPCWYCDEHFDTPELCLEHTKSEHVVSGDKICEKCSRICKTVLSFAQHQKQCDQFNPGQKLSPHVCPQCSKAFAFKSDLTIHLEVHNEEGKYACSKCDFRAKSQLLINNHTQRMHAEKQGVFKCDDEHCQSTFKTKQSMRIHYVNMHTEKGNKRYREQLRKVLDRQKLERQKRLAAKSYVCADCNIDFFSNLRLISHRKSCHNTDIPKNFVCDQCGKDFSRAPALRFHLEHSHSDVRPFICEHCGKGFKSSCNLKDHVNHTHSEEGRKEYNEKMRLHNQRRKLVAQALSRQAQAQQQASSGSSHLNLNLNLNEQNGMYMDPVGAMFGFHERQFN